MNNILNTSSSSSSSSDDERPIVRQRKIYRKRENWFNKYNDIEFFSKFRLTKRTVTQLLNQIENEISHPTNRGGCVQPIIQLLLALRFFATGSMLISAGDFMGVSKATASRIVKRVATAIASLSRTHIQMPRDAAEMGRSAQEFYKISRFPRVIGAIDCTLIKIQSPGGNDAEIFQSSKGYFALNVQTVADTNLKIRNIVARWPGSSDDQTVFDNSRLKHEFENGRYGQYLLLGDSGYEIEPYLMTPLQHTKTAAENLYNESQIRTRTVVERQYGAWKRRFPVLSTGLKLNIDTTMIVIVATAVLHNIAIDMNEDIPDDWLYHLNIDANENPSIESDSNLDRGRNERRLIINEHFAVL